MTKDGTFQRYASATKLVEQLGVDDGTTADANDRYQRLANGTQKWGDGTNAPDVVLERTGTGQLSLSSGTLLQKTPIINITASTTLTAASHSGALLTVNAAAGVALTLPAASGSGARFRVFIGTTITSNSTTIKVANASDTMVGGVLVLQDAGSTVAGFEAGSTDDTITLNGSTTGGIKGDLFTIEDVATNLFMVWGNASGTGTEATPFSATV